MLSRYAAVRTVCVVSDVYSINMAAIALSWPYGAHTAYMRGDTAQIDDCMVV